VTLRGEVGHDTHAGHPGLLAELRHRQELLDHRAYLAWLAVHDFPDQQHGCSRLIVASGTSGTQYSREAEGRQEQARRALRDANGGPAAAGGVQATDDRTRFEAAAVVLVIASLPESRER